MPTSAELEAAMTGAGLKDRLKSLLRKHPIFLKAKRQEKITKLQLTAQAAATTQRRRLRGLGRASTILTSGRGVLGEAPVARKTLLGQ